MKKKWEILHKFRVQPFDSAQGKSVKPSTRAQVFDSEAQTRGAEGFKVDGLIQILLNNRGVKTKKEIEAFLNPKLDHVTVSSVGIDKKQLKRAVDRIKRAIDKQEQIVVFGDYDVDGICGTAVLWETLHGMGAKAMPYIPHRMDEGYGLSVKGIQNVILNLFQDPHRREMPKRVRHDNGGLIITVDNGIVASNAVEFANKQGIDVIITDHHVPSKKLPKAYAIVHTTKLCGAGVAWMLAQDLKRRHSGKRGTSASRIDSGQARMTGENDHLALVALATIADLVPLIGANRLLTKYGLEVLRKTDRVGILALCKEAGIDQSAIDTYEVGHIIAPRLNAMGRLEYAMESLRLLCTKDKEKARALAYKLGSTNRQRQLLTEETVLHAITGIRNHELGIMERKLLFVAHESYQQGVIGLVAGKLVEQFYRPAIVVSVGEQFSKASARSIHGFNIIEFIRSASEFLVDAGGHPMAAGFTVETAKLTLLQKALEERINLSLDDGLLTRLLHIDCELPLSLIRSELYDAIQQLAPFGMGNPVPTFVSRNVTIEDMRLVGKDGKHVKLRLQQTTFGAIAFGMGERAHEFHIGDTIDVVYTIDEDTWLARRSLGEGGSGNNRLQLKVRDIKRQ